MINPRPLCRCNYAGLVILASCIATAVSIDLLVHPFASKHIVHAINVRFANGAEVLAGESITGVQRDTLLPTVDPSTNITINPKVMTVRHGQGVGSAIVFIVRALRYMELIAPGETLYLDLYSNATASITRVFLEEYVVLCGVDMQRVRCLRNDETSSLLTIEHTQMMMNEDVDALHRATPFTRRYALSQQLYAKYFSFTEAVRENVLAAVDPNAADLSIMVRRGDKLTVEKYLTMAPIDLYTRRITQLRAKTVFVATDDYTMVEELQKTMPGVRFLTACPPTERGFFLNDSRKWGRDEIKQHLDKFSKEIYALISAPFAVLDMNSNAFAVALYGRIQRPFQTLVPVLDDRPPQSSPYYKRMALRL